MSVAIHIEADTDDADALRAATAKMVKGLTDVRSAYFSTSEGTYDLKAEETVEAETTDGRKVKVKNPTAFQRKPDKYEYRAFRATADFAAEHGLKEGDWVTEDPKKQRRYMKATAAQIAATAEDPTVAADDREQARQAARQARGAKKGGKE